MLAFHKSNAKLARFSHHPINKLEAIGFLAAALNSIDNTQ